MNSWNDFWKSHTTLMTGPTFQIGVHMSKKPSTPPRQPTPTTPQAASRAQSAVAKKFDGKVPAGSYVGRLQRAAVKSK